MEDAQIEGEGGKGERERTREVGEPNFPHTKRPYFTFGS